MRKILIGTIALLLASAVHAQTQMGTGAYGGSCLGPYCGQGKPANAGVGAADGPCYGPYCGSADQPSMPSSMPDQDMTPSYEQNNDSLGENSLNDPLASPVDSPSGR